MLEEAGYIRRKGGNWELTPRGIRKIGQKALAEIYAQLKTGRLRASTPCASAAPAATQSDETKKYEFGDPFHLHLEQDDHERPLPRGRRGAARPAEPRTTSRSTGPSSSPRPRPS